MCDRKDSDVEGPSTRQTTGEDRVSQITTVAFVPDDVAAERLRARFDPDRLDPPTGAEPPKLTVEWYRQEPHDWFRVDYADPNTGRHVGWHRDEDHPDLGGTHFQWSAGGTERRREVTFDHDTPSPVCWEIVETLRGGVRPIEQCTHRES